MADTLDSIVKGAPVQLPGRDLPKAVGGTSPIASSTTSPPTPGKNGGNSSDPLSHTPSSPSMIYLNLLILEASLRAQYLELRARKRHHQFFLLILAAWQIAFTYALFLAPREDGRGVGGSVYWMVETTERLGFLGGIITGILIWATGVWERGVRWPRRWFTVTNRGLRGFNCKLVVMKRPWWKEILAYIGWFLTYGAFSSSTGGGSYRFVEPSVLREVDKELNLSGHSHPALPIISITGGGGIGDEEKGGHEEDLSPGGDYVKLLLLAKPFSPTFRENWELYRAEYWERENERRALLRAKLKERDLRLRKQHGGWFWWLPWRQSVAAVPVPLEKPHMRSISGDSEKAHHPRHAAVVAGEHRRTRSGSGSSIRRASMSTNTSRSPTPTLEPSLMAPDGLLAGGGITRKGSNSSDVSEKRRSRKLSPGGSGGSGSTGRTGRPRVESRSITPETPSPLAKESPA